MSENKNIWTDFDDVVHLDGWYEVEHRNGNLIEIARLHVDTFYAWDGSGVMMHKEDALRVRELADNPKNMEPEPFLDVRAEVSSGYKGCRLYPHPITGEPTAKYLFDPIKPEKEHGAFMGDSQIGEWVKAPSMAKSLLSQHCRGLGMKEYSDECQIRYRISNWFKMPDGTTKANTEDTGKKVHEI